MDLLCVIAASEERAREATQEARAIGRAQGLSERGSPVARDGVRAVAYRRQNGSGAPVVEDLRTGSWILAAGTWFHRSGFATGDEGLLLERFVAGGIDRLACELEGFFTMVAWDAGSRVLSVVTDLCGTCHVFARVEHDAVVLSGSSLTLAALGDGALDPVGVQEFLYTGVLYEGRTTHRNVRKLPAATILSWDRSLVCRERAYWTIAHVSDAALDGDAATAGVTEALVSASTRIGRVFARPVCDLTGGRDSRAVTAAMIEARAPFTAVVCGPESNRDVVVSKQLARIAGFAHRHLPAEEPASLAEIAATIDVTDGEYDLVEYARVRRIHQSLARAHDGSLNGTFGELARGHWLGRIRSDRGRPQTLDPSEVGAMRFVTQPSDPSIVPADLRLDLVAHFAGAVERTNQGLASQPLHAQMQNLYLMMRLQHWFGRIASSTDRIWPVLAPWSLRSVLAVVLSVAPRAKTNGLLVKRMLERLNPALARSPLENGAPALPLTLRNLPWFWPAPVEAARKGFERVRARAGLAPRAGLPPRMQLLIGDKTIHDVLDPSNMRASSVLDRMALKHFLARAVQRDFAGDLQWNRILSLELTLRRRDELRETLRVARLGAGVEAG